ncbi:MULTISPECIES: PLP-dependent aminotransferase family protein [Bacillus]|uniref:PLP-dependent aminotransferase family protein n=1 Tax=Bacillus glycinifermentans TaxID=1664069 RepID=A0AAJ4D103_9BACI|nr:MULTISPECIES: PLP-dependent aminotransferase family protein [Bacillus]KKB73622.1 GntR family transcriptional regulator [Bacillus sp. TH008]MBU8785994.1 PLP-dependent aminotransferase family protein [Bacillus glycinifermentans]MDU0072242.1 PLP-dependent aminotransferase family protein [Bacillus sp. IG6]MED8019867.1 PLP-dependent aminotransferase family protein [Bacillus glycinifermentans]NUJ15470.1 PLP-dependent aminotransferase family protein [Bacillus glycinifermentans]
MQKYVGLMNKLESLIEERSFQEGDKLPSIRTLAGEFRVSKSTVIRALSELEKRHMIYSVPKSGYYVVKKTNKLLNRERSVIDFAASAPDPDVFPYLDFQHCINKAIDTYKNDLFIYGTPKGLPSLIEVVQKELANAQVFTKQDNIFITSGVQQALSLLASIPFPDQKRKILIEQPTYHLLLKYLEVHRLPVTGIERTAQGIDLQRLELLFRTEDIKFFYTMPRFHNPLGSSYTEKEKKSIVRLAEKYGVFIVEDDFLGDLEGNQKADPLFSYDVSSRVIYLKSFSKIIFPGLRVGVAVLPDSLTEAFNQYKRLTDIDSSMLSQAALEIYLKSGMFERHKQKIRASYEKRSRLLHGLLSELAGSAGELVDFHLPDQPCVHTHLVLDRKLPASRIIKNMRKRGVLLEPVDAHYLAGFQKRNLLKINTTNVKEEDIPRGIELLKQTICTSRY